jgi:hypothetical protein
MERNHLRIGHSYSFSGPFWWCLVKFFLEEEFYSFSNQKLSCQVWILAKKNKIKEEKELLSFSPI